MKVLRVILTLCLEELLLKPSTDAIVVGADSKLGSSVVATVTTWGLSEILFVASAIFRLLKPSPSKDRRLLGMNNITLYSGFGGVATEYDITDQPTTQLFLLDHLFFQRSLSFFLSHTH